MRHQISLNENWKYHKGDIKISCSPVKGPIYSQSKTQRKLMGPAAYGFDDKTDPYGTDTILHNERWELVNLPHDFIIDQDNDPTQNNAHGYFNYFNAWYRRHFEGKEEWRDKRIILQFDGIAGASTVYLNGCLLKHNFSSYNNFEIDISNYVYFNRDNVIAVYVNTEEFEGWWYQGGGIYRSARIIITDPIAIEEYGVFAPARKIDDKKWRIDFETSIVNNSFEDEEFEVVSTVIDPEGNEVTDATCVSFCAMRKKQTVNYCVDVKEPQLWDIESPIMYTVKTVLSVRGEQRDENITRIGFRTLEFDSDTGFYLNGRHILIKGVCAHQDCGLTGLAVPDNILRYKAELIKEMGANAYRTSHYQHPTAIMDAFDELGILVLGETRWFETTEESDAQLSALIKRDRNRPSVIMWSTSNEEPYHITDVGRRLNRAIMARIRQLDNSRMISVSEDKKPEESCVFEDCDVIGINYNLLSFDKVHEQYPDKPIFSSECCATGTTRDWFLPSDCNGHKKDRDVDTNNWFKNREETWKFITDRPYIMGEFQWAGFEHRGEAMWPAVCSKSGAIDLYLQKKGAFYQNQSHWSDKPMAHILPHWNFRGMEGEMINVPVYTNCEMLELFLNGKSFGIKSIEKYGHGEWDIPYEPGELTVKGFIGGKEVVSDTRKTSKKAERLVLKLENSLEANGTDLALITCTCIDEDGLYVPDASEYVTFTTGNPARIVATGSDNCDHNRIGLNERRMYAGRISVAVRPAKGQKTLEIYATSENCGTTVLRINLD